MTIDATVTTRLADEVLKGHVFTEALRRAGDLKTYDPEAMNDADETSIIDTLSVLATGQKGILSEQRRLCAPFELGLSQIRSKFQPTAAAINAAVALGKTLLLKYRAVKKYRAEQARLEQEELARKALERSAPLADLPVGPELVEPGPMDAAPVTNQVRGGIGTATGRRTLKVKVVDVKLVAEKYPHLLTLNEAAARLEYRAAAVREKEPTLPGLEFWYEEGISIGSR